MQLMTNLCTA